MAYCTNDDIILTISKEILIQLTDDQKDGSYDPDVCTNAISQASGVMDTALLEGGYAVPVAEPIPAGAGFIKGCCVWLSVGLLAGRRGVIPEDYKFWMDYYARKLEDISKGDLALPIPTSPLNMPQSTTELQERELTRSKYDKDGTLLNVDDSHTLDAT